MKKLILFTFLFQNAVFASDSFFEGSEEIKHALSSHLYSPNYLTMILGLLLVIILIYITGIIYQKLIRVKISTGDSNTNKIDILYTAALGQGKNLHVIKVGHKTMLIGATQSNITYLNTIKNDMITLEESDVK